MQHFHAYKLNNQITSRHSRRIFETNRIGGGTEQHRNNTIDCIFIQELEMPSGVFRSVGEFEGGIGWGAVFI